MAILKTGTIGLKINGLLREVQARIKYQPPTTFRRSSTSLYYTIPRIRERCKVRKQSVNHLFCSGNSVYFAVKDAIYYARQEDEEEVEEGKVFNLDLPCTPERVRIACGNAFAYGSRNYQTRITI